MTSHLNAKDFAHPGLNEAARRLEQLNPDQFELYFERNRSTHIEVKDQQVDALTRSEDVGLAIRLIKDRRVGFSFTTSLDTEAIHRAAAAAFEVATNMPEDSNAALFSFGTAVYPAVDNLDTRGLETPLAKKIALAKAVESQCRAADRRITAIRTASLRETFSEVQMVDSGGESVRHLSSIFTSSVTCKAEEAGDSQMGGEFAFSNELERLDTSSVGKLAARWATELLGATPGPTLHCPAVLRNSVVAELIEFLSTSFSAEEIDKGRSMLAGKKDSRVFSEKVSIVDDGLLPGGYNTSPFDAEGVPSARVNLVDGGFVSNFLYDTYYARKYSVEPTGNSVRGIKSPPSIGFTNLYMEKGPRTFEQLCDGISQGILITDLMGVHTANPVTGDFSLGASGILIEKGKLTRPVRGIAVAGNVLELFRKMTDIGSDLKFFGSVGAPSVRVSDISVSGS